MFNLRFVACLFLSLAMNVSAEEQGLSNKSEMELRATENFRSDVRRMAEEKEAARTRMLQVMSETKLEDMLFVGVITMINGGKADILVRMPDGETFRVGVGTKMGLNSGIYAGVSDGKASIEELVPVCGAASLKKRITYMELERPISSGTTIAYSKENGKYVCEQKPN